MEVAAADCIILDVDEESTSGGRYVEWGVALGRYNMLKIVVGENHWGVFNTLADHRFKDWVEVLNFLVKNHQDEKYFDTAYTDLNVLKEGYIKMCQPNPETPTSVHQAAPAVPAPVFECPQTSVGPQL